MIKTIISACKKVIFLPKRRGIMRVQGDKKSRLSTANSL